MDKQLEVSNQEKYLKLVDAAMYLEISISTLRNLIRRSDFPACRVGRQIRIPRSHLDAWVLHQHME